ncbi:Thymidylate kinase [Umbelopsis sp. WA50703]
MINSYLTNASELSDQAVHLLFSANRWEAMDSMRALLLSGTTLVVDRYAYSGVAFTAAKGLDISWCKNPDIGLLTPDLVLFLDLPIESAEKRGGFGEERYEKRDMQIKIIDADRSMSAIEEDIRHHTLSAIEAAQSSPLSQDLWQHK